MSAEVLLSPRLAALRRELPHILRFGAVGLANTGLSFGIIVSLLWLGTNAFFANACGYVAGITLSFILNRAWTFRSRMALNAGLALRYLLTIAIAYSGNLAVLLAARHFGWIHNPLAHLAGMMVYTPLFYLGASRLVFTDRHSAHTSAGSVQS